MWVNGGEAYAVGWVGGDIFCADGRCDWYIEFRCRCLLIAS